MLENDFNEKKTDFYDIFYNKIFKKFVDHIAMPLEQLEKNEENRTDVIATKQLVLELITHCIKLHG